MTPDRLEEICASVNQIRLGVIPSEQDRVRYLQSLIDFETELKSQTFLEILVQDFLVEVRLEILSRPLSK